MTATSAARLKTKSRLEGLRIPGSTYRLQLNARFKFRHAIDITGYLHQLGITDCYASPIFTARPESTHGYDVCNCSQLNRNLGTDEDFELWSERLHQLDMGLLLDIVPNHMGADPLNPWWWDVLKNGPASSFSSWFDINWRRPERHLQSKIL